MISLPFPGPRRAGLPTLLAGTLAAGCLLAPGAALAGIPSPLHLRHVALDLPGPPAALISADLDGDGRRDLLAVVAYVQWGEVGMDRMEGLVQVTEVVPALFDRREALAFRAVPDGTFERTAPPLPLPTSVVSVEAGPPGLPVVALTDQGLSVFRLGGRGARARLLLEPVIEDPPVLAGTGSLISGLRMVRDLNGDGSSDVLFPSRSGPAVYLSRGDELQTEAAARVRLPGDRLHSGAVAWRRYPLPGVTDLDGDGLPDLSVTEPGSQGSIPPRIHVLRGMGGGRFETARELDLSSLGLDRPPAARGKAKKDGESPGLAFLGDLDGEGLAEVVVKQMKDGRGGMKEAKRPHYEYRFHHIRPDWTVDPEPYARLDAVGHGFSVNLGDLSTQEFQDLDGDGRKDLVTITLRFSVLQVVRILATKRISVGLDFHVYAQQENGGFRLVPGLDLSEKLRINLTNLKIGRFAQFAGDFDGDGRQDFVHLGRGNQITIHRGAPGCVYPKRPDLVISLDEAPTDLGLVRVEDLDGDGRADIRVTRFLTAPEAELLPKVRVDLYLSGGAE